MSLSPDNIGRGIVLTFDTKRLIEKKKGQSVRNTLSSEMRLAGKNFRDKKLQTKTEDCLNPNHFSLENHFRDQ